MNRMAGGFTIAAGALILLAAIAPWATSEGPFSENGLTRGDGWLATGLGVLMIGLGILAVSGRPDRIVRSVSLVLAGAGLGMAFFENAKVSGAIAPLGPSVHLGIGI